MKTEGQESTKIKDLTESQKALWYLTGAMVAGLLGVLVYASSSGERTQFIATVSIASLLAGASAFVGGTLGFLFGIPRTLQQEGLPGGVNPSAESRRIDYRVNTNLEQISDWLTKILVGVGLTQIAQIRDGFLSLTEFAAEGLGPQSQSQLFVSALICYFTVLGFLFGYLWTRLVLAGALRTADEAALGALAAKVQEVTEKAETTERQVDELKKQADLDAAALLLTYRHLNPSADLSPVTQEALNAALDGASRPIRVQVFNQAWKIRSENWEDPNNLPTMERTIPLFRALIQTDKENRYHMNHGQLGFALKDKVNPDWNEAEKELTRAIEIRGPWKETGRWLFYEFNRAICRIMLDPAFALDEASDPERTKQILDDLDAAAHADGVKAIMRSDPTVHKWMALNKIPDKRLFRK